MRNIYVVNATQVVTSESHPEGLYSTVSGFPVLVDSRSYGATEANPNGDTEVALAVADDAFTAQVKAFMTGNNANRTMWSVTLSEANGVQIKKRFKGAFPDMTPPEPAPNQEQPQE